MHGEYCEVGKIDLAKVDKVFRGHKKTVKQSEFFYQFYRSLILEFIHWEWQNSNSNIPRSVWQKVYNTLYPKGSGGLPLPQLGDLLMIPDSDWFITEDYVEYGQLWKSTYEDLVEILFGLGFLIPNIYDFSKGKTYTQNQIHPDRKQKNRSL